MTLKRHQLLCCSCEARCSSLETANQDLQRRHHKLKCEAADVWEDKLALFMLSWDALHCSHHPDSPHPRLAISPYTNKRFDMTHAKVVQHRLFNLMDCDGDGVLGEEDVNCWVELHVKMGSISRQEVITEKFKGRKLNEAEFRRQDDWELREWVAEKIWAMLREIFAPQSQDPRWQVCIFLLRVCWLHKKYP